MADDQRPQSNPPPTAPPPSPYGNTAHPLPTKDSRTMLDKFQNYVTGGAQDTLKGAITPKDMNYYHEDDGK